MTSESGLDSVGRDAMIQWKDLRFPSFILPRLGHIGLGLSLGTLFVVTFGRVWLTFGTGWESILGLLTSLALASVVAPKRVSLGGRQYFVAAGLAATVFATLLTPLLIENYTGLLASTELGVVAQPTSQLGLILVGMFATTFPIFWGTCFSVRNSISPRLILAGIACSLFLTPTALGTMTVFNFCFWVSVTICGAASILAAIRRDSATTESPFEDQPLTRIQAFAPWIQVGIAGVALAIGVFVIRQLVLENLATEFSIWGSLLVGGLLAAALPQFVLGSVWSMLAVWAGLLLMGYSSLSWLAFQETLNVSNTWLLFLSRQSIVFAVLAPIGFFWRSSHAQQRGIQSILFSMSMLATGIGYLAAVAMKMSPRLGLVLLVVSGLIVVVIMVFFVDRRTLHGRVQKLGFGVTVSVAVLGLLFSEQFVPTRSEKILFSGNTYGAARAGLPYEQLAWVDDGRLLDAFDTVTSHWSLWRHRGQQTVIRRNGLPKGMHSNHPTTCPQNPGEVLPAWLPLVFHPSAENVLVLGLHPTTLATCESFPLLSVTVLEDAETPEPIRQWVNDGLVTRELFRIVNVDPVTGVACQHPIQYDVIVCPQTLVATTSGHRKLTQEFYASVRRRLTKQGVFCQRISYVDLGPEMVAQVMVAFRSQFPEVLVTESVPGELVLMGTPSDQPLMTEDALSRFQSRHARRVFSDLGWDWSVPIVHGTLNTAAVDTLIAARSVAFSMTQPNAAFQLPVEVSRWANKFNDSRIVLAEHGDTLIGLLGESPLTDDIAKRLTDVQLAQQVVHANPDQVWGYRAAIKKQLTDRPRSKIMQVDGGGLKNQLHPEDQKRKDYLLKLGELANRESLNVSDVGELLEFSEPFDPLVSQFSYFEAIQLLNRIENSDSRSAQLDLLLHTIYFSTGTDRSVRNICEAIAILVADEFDSIDEVERWDQLNSLLDALRHRWQLRFAVADTRSKYEIVDTEKSLESIEAALAKMDELSIISDTEWNLRRDFVDDHLVHPLKQYRSRQLNQIPVVRAAKKK